MRLADDLAEERSGIAEEEMLIARFWDIQENKVVPTSYSNPLVPCFLRSAASAASASGLQRARGARSIDARPARPCPGGACSLASTHFRAPRASEALRRDTELLPFIVLSTLLQRNEMLIDSSLVHFSLAKHRAYLRFSIPSKLKSNVKARSNPSDNPQIQRKH